MKIEKINDNQIRCTLSKEDLSDRNIQLSELAYGTGKTKELFQDMMRQANDDFGFEVNDTPLMVEAIPLSPESIVLVITKVEDPSETEDHLAKFFSKEVKDTLLSQFEKREMNLGDIEDIADRHVDELEIDRHQTLGNEEDSLLYSIYIFNTLNEVIKVSKLAAPFFKGDSAVFKSPFNNKYYLSLCMDAEDEASMIKVCGILTEHGTRENPTYAKELFYIEHFDEVIGMNAIEKLAKI